MNIMLLRPYRKNISMYGLIYLAGKEQIISIKNISISGILAQLDGQKGSEDIKAIFDSLSDSSVIDLYIPEMKIAGEAHIIRADLQDDRIQIALEYKNVTYEVNDALYKRKAYRKNLPGPGQILIDGRYLEFNAVNVSVDGIMIRLNEPVSIQPGLVTHFNFERLDLDGEAEVKWLEQLFNGDTLMGLQYLHMEKSSLKGIPDFTLAMTA
ncbi:MAG: PilZ domain-containing protein [Methylococcaceae bacterium]|nr:PilZ domain-containing protein [Methylococcaceae bacterium]